MGERQSTIKDQQVTQARSNSAPMRGNGCSPCDMDVVTCGRGKINRGSRRNITALSCKVFPDYRLNLLELCVLGRLCPTRQVDCWMPLCSSLLGTNRR